MGILDEWSYNCIAVDRTRLTGQLTLRVLHALIELKPHSNFLFKRVICPITGTHLSVTRSKTQGYQSVLFLPVFAEIDEKTTLNPQIHPGRG